MFFVVASDDVVAGCYPAQCSKEEMATNNLLLGQKYGFQVGPFNWLIGIITTHAARRRLGGRWLTSSFTRDQSPGLGMNQRRTHRQVDISKYAYMQPLSNFYGTRV